MYTDAYGASPVCSPCRTSLLTGVHVPVHGVVENSVGPHKDGLSTYFDLLHTNTDYFTMIIGKTHFSPLPSVDYKNIHTGNDDMRCSDESCPYLNEDQFLETYLTNDMIKQVGNHVANSSETPFFVHLSFVSPHPPSTPPHPWNEFHSDDDISSLDLNYEVGDIDKLPNQTKMRLSFGIELTTFKRGRTSQKTTSTAKSSTFSGPRCCDGGRNRMICSGRWRVGKTRQKSGSEPGTMRRSSRD